MSHPEGTTLGRALAAAVMLGTVWLALSGSFYPILLGFGVIGVVVVVYVALRMQILDSEGFPLHLSAGVVFSYLPWLTKEIARSNWDVARIILDPRLPISPAMRSFTVTPRTDLGRVIYANSITLTPGTITTGIIGDTFEIHALTRAAWDGTEQSEMGRRVCKLEGEH